MVFHNSKQAKQSKMTCPPIKTEFSFEDMSDLGLFDNIKYKTLRWAIETRPSFEVVIENLLPADETSCFCEAIFKFKVHRDGWNESDFVRYRLVKPMNSQKKVWYFLEKNVWTFVKKN